MKLFLISVSILFFLGSSGQTTDTTDIFSSDAQQNAKAYVSAAFKSTRVINAHSMEMLGKGNLDFRILHRFGEVSNGINQLFGLDQASMRMGFDYGISKNLMVGFGRSTLRKEIDVLVKMRFIHQSTGPRSSPVSLLFAAGAMINTEKSFAAVKPSFSDRSAYYIQMLAGRKFSPVFSLQFSPIFLYTNTPYNAKGDKVLFAPGMGARIKVSKRVALTADYHHPVNTMDSASTSPLSVGVDIETGGHVFQLHFSNAAGMNERAYLTQTTGRFFKGDIRFGFNLSRIFQIGRNR